MQASAWEMAGLGASRQRGILGIMSEANVEVVRSIYRAWTEGRSAAPWIEKDLEYVNPPDAVETGVKHGRRHLATIRDVYPELRIEPERFIDAGEDIVVIGTIRGRGRGSGLETRWQQGYIWTVRDGKAVRFRWFSDPQQALTAAGLADQDPSAD